MQTEQTQPQRQTTTVQKKGGKKYIYGGLGIVVIGLAAAYAWLTVQYKFLHVDPKTMGTFFYSWRALGANDAMLKDMPGKFTPGTGEINKIHAYIKNLISDKYSEHFPRGIENMHTFAYPGYEMSIKLRNKFVEHDSTAATNSAMADAKAKNTTATEEEKNKAALIDEYLKTNTRPIFFETKSKGEPMSIITELYDSLSDGAHKEGFKQAMIGAVDLFIGMATRQSGYTYNELTGEVPAQAVTTAQEIIEGIDKNKEVQTGVDNLTELDVVNKNKQNDLKIFLKKYKLQNATSNDLATKFFEEAKKGTLTPYFSYAYSRFAYMLYFLTLDLPIIAEDSTNITSQKIDGPVSDTMNEAFKNKQDLLAKRAQIVSDAIALGFANGLSSTIDASEVKKQRNSLIYLAFTPKVTSPTPEVRSALEKIVSDLQDKKTELESLS
ncbi:hypothetical protein NEOKW01_0298 [Nematocida sp. AWRm80]|nr:hypothetical protein NEOKW01_0298 [Nematocida sp. AWRm80]